MSILFFLFGPLLLLSSIVCADARGGAALAMRAGGPSESGLRYVVIFGAVVTFVGLLLLVAK